MAGFEPRPRDFEAEVHSSFSRQTGMQAFGAVTGRVGPGEVELEISYRAVPAQQHGFIQGGVVTAIIDSACGSAALSLSAPDTTVLTVEYKVNFVAPAKGERLLARGEVVRQGVTVAVCKDEVVAYDGGEEKLVAIMLSAVMLMPNRLDLAG